MRSAANVSQTLRRTEWKSLLKRLPRTLAEYIGEERNRMNLHPDPQFDDPLDACHKLALSPLLAEQLCTKGALAIAAHFHLLDGKWMRLDNIQFVSKTIMT